MAPSRRKGGSKAAAAAAARRQWKVGDLVLAKIKGFPAWPATVSEPEKWGYSADSKKVLVYFFGTQQIAFCNPADVEKFTEEKKQSLVKRQGKGADFVRAVQEIIDSYENLKRETHVGEGITSGEISGANASNPVDLLGSKDQREALELTHNSQMKSSNSVTDKNGPRCAVDGASGRDKSLDKEASFEEPSDRAAATVKSYVPVTYSSRKRSAGLHPQGYVTHRNAPVRRFRSLSQVQNFVVPCTDDGKSTGNVSASIVQNVSVRRNRHIRKSADLSDSDDIASSALASDGSMEDSGSGSLTIDSESFSPNEGSTIDSISKPEHFETIECLEDVELNKGLDIEIKAVVNKRKRKPNRKRATSDAANPTSKRDEASVQHASQSSQNVCADLKERWSEQDGDEHLPLLKRARVRKLSSTETEFNSIGDSAEKSSKEGMNSPQQVNTSSNCENGSPAEGDSFVLNGVLDKVSPSKSLAPCSENGSKISKIKNDQIFGCSVDGEAALPPSKRLHRALEAMSANAAEEGQACREASSALMASSGRCCISSIKRCPCAASNSHGGHDIELQGVDTCSSNGSAKLNVCCFSTSSYSMVSTENKSSTEVDKHLIKIENHEICKDALPGAREESVEDLCDSLVCQVVGADSQIQLQGSLSPNLDRKWGEVESNQDPSGPLLSSNDKDNIRTVDYTKKVCNTSEHAGISLDSVSDIKDCSVTSPQNITDMAQNEVAVRENTEDLKPPVGDGSKVNDMCEVVGEVKCKEQQDDVNSVSISDNCLAQKGILGHRSSPSLTDGGDCLPQGSPPYTSVCNVSTSDSSNVLQNNGSCSPDVHLHQKKTLSDPDVDEEKDGSLATQQSRSMGKSSEAGHAALLYFEAMLGTLMRTKESIGRATRIAIDCAKFGIAAKVVEILVNSLESESSLHRRVDLFFLVDSITQCSRGLKGDVGGVYLSAIQAVLPRLLSAAVPPGNSHAQENHRQCLKVLRLWLERGILPESIVRHHIRELDLFNGSASAGAFSRRTLRTERPLDDPIRDMEDMLVDEYGSNASFHLPGFCMPRMLKDEGDGSDSDGENFEAVTPEHNSETHEVCETIHSMEKHRHILEDVDGELEMEDVAPSCDIEMNSFCSVNGAKAASISHNQLEKNLPPTFGPPLPQDMLPTSPPTPSSSPPRPPPPPPPSNQPFCAASDPYAIGVDSKLYKHEQTMQDNLLPPMVQPFVAPSSSQPISEVLPYRVPECRDMPMQMPAKSASTFSNLPVPMLDNFCHSDGVTIHNKDYPLRPPQHVPSDQFSFVRREWHLKPQREFPPPAYPNRQHFAQNMERENFFNNHERLKPPAYEFRERWRVALPCPDPQYQDRDMHAPYGCHPSESTRFPGHGWRFHPRSMNHSNSMPFRPPFQDAIPVASRGPSFWGPR